MKKLLIAAFILVVLSFVIAAYYYPILPDRIISHWNVHGAPNGYMGKFWGLFLIPIISLVLFLIFLAFTKIDPLKKNIKEFQNFYDGFILILTFFMLYMVILIVVANLKIHYNFIYAIIPAFSLLFFYLGVLIENSKRNWFIGIRTPWTLSSDYVWEKTHHLGGNLYKVSAIITLFGVLVEKGAIWFILIPVIVSSVWLVVYSYYTYKEERATLQQRKKK